MVANITTGKYSSALSRKYIETVMGSVNSLKYRQHHVLTSDGITQTVFADSGVASAYHVSSILNSLQLSLGEIRLNILDILADLEVSAWERTKTLSKGAVVVWEPYSYVSGKPRQHIGFYIGNDRAVSNISDAHIPTEHDVYFRDEKRHLIVERSIVYIFTHPLIHL